jgi:hypothetical protein
MSESTQPAPAATLQSIRGLTASDLPTLTRASETFEHLDAEARRLRGTEFAAIGETIEHLATAAAKGDSRAKNLPDAQARIESIRALLPVLPSAQPSAPAAETNIYPAKIASMHERKRTAAAISAATVATIVAKSRSTTDDGGDSATFDRYASLSGSARREYLAEHRQILIREHARRSAITPALTKSETDVLTRYSQLTGKARLAYYNEHERELWALYRKTHRAAAGKQTVHSGLVEIEAYRARNTAK